MPDKKKATLYVFGVSVHCADGTFNDYIIVAPNDCIAREKAVRLHGEREAYCDINHLYTVDAVAS